MVFLAIGKSRYYVFQYIANNFRAQGIHLVHCGFVISWTLAYRAQLMLTYVCTMILSNFICCQKLKIFSVDFCPLELLF